MKVDIEYLLGLQNFREATDGAFDDFAVQFCEFSYGVFIFMYAAVFFWGVNKKTGAFLFLNVAWSRFIMQFVKLTFCVYRPWIRSSQIKPLEYPSGYSFPSGHTITATANFGTLAREYKKSKGIMIFFIVLILLTAFSRNLLGVHTPQDVLVAMLIGAIVVIIGSRVWEWIYEDSKRDWIIPACGIVLTTVFLLYISLKSYPMDYVGDKLIVDPAKMAQDGFKDAGRFLGVTLGWFVERRWVKFSMDVPTKNKVWRCLIGVAILIIFDMVLCDVIAKEIFSGQAGAFISKFAEVFVLIALYPWCFKKYEEKKKIGQ